MKETLQNLLVHDLKNPLGATTESEASTEAGGPRFRLRFPENAERRSSARPAPVKRIETVRGVPPKDR